MTVHRLTVRRERRSSHEVGALIFKRLLEGEATWRSICEYAAINESDSTSRDWKRELLAAGVIRQEGLRLKAHGRGTFPAVWKLNV